MQGEISEEETFNTLKPADVTAKDPPVLVKPTQHLKDNLHALHTFFEIRDPPKIHDRSTKIQIVRYGFGDASGSGFGSIMETSEGLKSRIGVWGYDDSEESSNFKEFENVVTTIEEEVMAGTLKGAMLYFFTDNSTVEGALAKGNSSSRKLFQLVLRFRKMQFQQGIKMIISHVSGKRMISQGTDDVSRGSLTEGVAAGENMLDFIPLHLSAVERDSHLRAWVASWAGE
jgi:hypothetical protein